MITNVATTKLVFVEYIMKDIFVAELEYIKMYIFMSYIIIMLYITYFYHQIFC